MNPQITQYNSYAATGSGRPFLFNQTYDITAAGEANTMDQIASEFYWMYGTDLVFLPREVQSPDSILGEYLAASIEKGFPIRMFIEEMEAWGGGGDIYSKFGLQVTDECTLYINKTSFFNAVSGTYYPKQGDLFYVNKAQKLFQISHVEDEVQPAFYLLGNRSGYKISCKLFSYSYEGINQSASAGIPEAIQALDNLIFSTEASAYESLNQKEERKTTKPVRTAAVPIVDKTEVDPLFGGTLAGQDVVRVGTFNVGDTAEKIK
jgi:hypothetical protein